MVIDIGGFMSRCNAIYDVYELASIGLKHPNTLQRKMWRLIKIVQDHSTDSIFVDGKAPPKEFWESADKVAFFKGQVKDRINFALRHIKNQSVVMYHSYIELIMAQIVKMILAKEESILRIIYKDRQSGYEDGKSKFTIKDIEHNKSAMVENEVERFIRIPIDKKCKYFKDRFNIDFRWADKKVCNIDIVEIDTLRHNIIHGNSDIPIDDYRLLEINNYIVGLGLHLLTQARLKYQIDIVWLDGLGRNYLR